MSAADKKLAFDRDVAIKRQSATQVLFLLKPFIAEHCFQEALDTLTDAMLKADVELTNGAQRKDYENWRNAIILTTPNPPVQP